MQGNNTIIDINLPPGTQWIQELKDEAYREQVFAYIAQEDTPRPLLFQLDLLREVGFGQVDILHKNSCFAAFGGIK